MQGMGPKTHSKVIDKILGFKIQKTENNLLKKYKAFYLLEKVDGKRHFAGTQAWIGLHPQVLQTPYSELSKILSLIRKNPKCLVDFGAAYGRVALVLNSFYPETEFIGYEIVKERIREGRRMLEKLNLDSKSQILHQDLLEEEFFIPEADVYFIYDFSDPQDVKKILKKLESKAYHKPFQIIAKGKGVRSLIQLKFPRFWCVHDPIHGSDWSIYSI